jgi:hypothetical protein
MLQILSYEAFWHKTVKVMYLEETNWIFGTYSSVHVLFYSNTTLEITILNCIVNPEEFGTQNVFITTLFSVFLFKGCGAYTINSD